MNSVLTSHTRLRAVTIEAIMSDDKVPLFCTSMRHSWSPMPAGGNDVRIRLRPCCIEAVTVAVAVRVAMVVAMAVAMKRRT